MTPRSLLTFVLLSMTGGVIFQVAYIRFVFLDATTAALGLTGQEYGTVVSVFGATATIMYFFGGWFADRFSPRLLICIALVGVGLCDLYIATTPGLVGIMAAHVVMAVLSTGLYWSALVKSIGLLAEPGSQGRFFGFLEGIRGATSTVVGLIGTAVVAAAIVPSAGVLTLIRIYGVLCFVLAAVILLAVREDRARLADAESTSVSLGQLLLAAKNPFTWLIGLTIAMAFTFYTTLGYFSPLLEHSFGVGVAAIGVIGVIRSYVFQFVAGPIGGIVVDKVTKSSTRFLGWMFLASSAMALGFLVLPKRPGLIVAALGLLLLLCLAVFMSRGVYWATVGELGIPASQRGGVIGLASGLAYLPDAFLPALCAWWIGDPAAGVPEQGGGYSTLFAVLVVAGLAGFALTRVTIRVAARRPLVAVPV
ncbi:MFS transporter [Frondihabitans australicus]|uniref:Putative MFS family arabinose efflux permease n=1 Tax=Frondihabitans australicus TaxID=386892 RepID=A0A495IHD8_9MICO|nr:MFS transporter [Frondihabitans australicus]RKR75423.1 putative MFS family arabinose efflux permease [Frondihabitans australicus]